MTNYADMVKTLLILVVSAMALGGCDSAMEEVSPAVEKRQYEGTIIALGDSLTAGAGVDFEKNYPFLLQQNLESEGFNYRVVNAGVSGETSSGTLSRLNWILRQEPDIVILEIGANDGLRGIEPSLIRKNIGEILKKLDDRGVITVLAGMKMVRSLGEVYTSEFDRVYSQLAEETGVIFMPFFLEGVAADPALNRNDGIHPNYKGYVQITENIFPYVVEAIRKHREST